MSYEQRPNSATLFRNRDKKNDNQPAIHVLMALTLREVELNVRN